MLCFGAYFLRRIRKLFPTTLMLDAAMAVSASLRRHPHRGICSQKDSRLFIEIYRPSCFLPARLV